MDTRAPARIIASCFALSAFAIALIAGLTADRSAAAILSTAVFALVGCYILGLLVSAAANLAVNERIETIKAENPIPKSEITPKTKQSSKTNQPSPPQSDQASHAA